MIKRPNEYDLMMKINRNYFYKPCRLTLMNSLSCMDPMYTCCEKKGSLLFESVRVTLRVVDPVLGGLPWSLAWI